jgi:hypothetical protein
MNIEEINVMRGRINWGALRFKLLFEGLAGTPSSDDVPAWQPSPKAAVDAIAREHGPGKSVLSPK